MVKQNQNSAETANNSSGGIGDIRDRASSAFSQFGDTSAGQIDSSPLIAVAGGIALGALIAAVLPQSERETQLLQPAGSKINGAGRDAVDRVRDSAKAKVDELAGDKVREFFGMGSSGES
ncbi:MAG: hypothetical protein ABR588_02115 [Sphingomicrobium sp.]|nr:hypothetical protein [Sphingomonadales bacterium]